MGFGGRCSHELVTHDLIDHKMQCLDDSTPVYYCPLGPMIKNTLARNR